MIRLLLAAAWPAIAIMLFVTTPFWAPPVTDIIGRITTAPSPRYGWIVVVIILVVISQIMVKAGLEILSPLGDALYFGASLVLALAILCFLFRVLPPP